jgi:hypothetical protein
MIYFCAERNRRTRVLAHPPLNGIDYLEIADAPDQTELLLTFLRDPAPLALTPAQVALLGGESVTNIRVTSVQPAAGVPATLRVTVDKAAISRPTRCCCAPPTRPPNRRPTSIRHWG